MATLEHEFMDADETTPPADRDGADINENAGLTDADNIGSQIILEAEEFFAAEGAHFANREEEAFGLYSKLAQRAKGSLYGHLASGQIAVMRGSLRTALAEFTSAQQAEQELLDQQMIPKPEDRVRIHLGLTYRKLGRYDEAIATFNSVNPDDREQPNAFAYAGLASVYRSMMTSAGEDSDEEADSEDLIIQVEAAVTKALEIEPNLLYARSIQIKVYQELARKNQAFSLLAEQAAEAVLKEDPTNWYVLGLFGTMLGRKDVPRAIGCFELAVQHAPRRETYARLGLGKLYKSQNPPNLELAEAMFEQILAVQPDHIGALSNLGDVLLRRGDLLAAKERLDAALGVSGGLPMSHQRYTRMVLARVLLSLDRISDAEAVISPIEDARNYTLINILKRITEEKDRAGHFFDQGNREQRSGNLEEALQFYLKVINRDPYAFAVYGRAVSLLNELKRPKEAISLSEQEISFGESAGYAEKQLGDSLDQMGNTRSAERMYRAALRRNASVPRRSPEVFTPQTVGYLQQKLRAFQSLQQRDALSRRSSFGPSLSPLNGGIQFRFSNTSTGQEETHSFPLIASFLHFMLHRNPKKILPIGKGSPPPIDQLGQEPTFLVAMTGVGKTVTVPIKILVSACEQYFRASGIAGNRVLTEFPQVFVVVPRIPIAESQFIHMNSSYQEHLSQNGVTSPRNYNLFGAISSLGKKNANAPIQFVTTGIFESLVFNDQLDRRLHRVIIDEAHVTIEQNPAVEIGIAIASARNVKIDYMSATVKTDNLEQDLGVKIVIADNIQYPILRKNLGRPVEECLLQLVEDYLIHTREELYPLRTDPKYGQVTRDLVDLKDRARGMLVIVNSHQGSMSDTMKFSAMIENAAFNHPHQKVAVFSYAASVARNKASEEQFKARIRAVEQRRGLYVIVATNVVEMGVTFDSLDYVVTMDNEFETSYLDGGQLLNTAALGVNALYQRIGRVGRTRAGMAFIAREYGAPYTTKSDEELREGLDYEPITFPIAKGNLQKLALFSYIGAWEDPVGELRKLRLPSMRTHSADIIRRFQREREKIRLLGLTQGAGLSPLGKRSLDFMSVENLDYKMLVALAEQGNDRDLQLVLMTAAATAESGLSRFLLSGTRFVADEASGRRESLRVGRYLRLSGEQLDAQTVSAALETGPDQLMGALADAGVALCDAALIAGYLEDGFRATSVEAEKVPEFAPEEEPIANNLSSALDVFYRGEGLPTESLPDSPEVIGMVQSGVGVTFDKNIVISDPDSEVITLYWIISHFYNKYMRWKSLPNVTEAQALHLDAALEKESLEAGLNPAAVSAAVRSFLDLGRHMSRKGPRLLSVDPGGRMPQSLQPSDQIRHDLLLSLLMERSLKFKWDDWTPEILAQVSSKALSGSVNMNKTLLQTELRKVMRDALEDSDIAMSDPDLKSLVEQVIAPAYQQYEREMKWLEHEAVPPELPFMSEGLRWRVLRFILDHNFGQQINLTYMDADPYPKCWVGAALSETNETLPVILQPSRTCLQLTAKPGDSVTVRGRLVPSYFFEREDEASVVERGGKRLAAHLRGKQRIFELQHVTKVP